MTSPSSSSTSWWSGWWAERAAGVAETAGGALLAAGFLTPAAGATLTSVMATAIHKVHGRNGPWNTSKGYEYNLVLIAALLGIADTGPGVTVVCSQGGAIPSADAALGIERSGPAVAVAQLAAGLAGSAAAIAIGKRADAPEPEPEAAPAPAEERAPYRPRFAERGKPVTAEAEQVEAEWEASR